MGWRLLCEQLSTQNAGVCEKAHLALHVVEMLLYKCDGHEWLCEGEIPFIAPEFGNI